MKYLLLICLITVFISGKSQDTTMVKKHGSITIKKTYKKVDHYPRIAGKLDGEITAAELCNSDGIYTVYPYEILSFQLENSYLRKDANVTVKGHVLSDEMCKIVSILPERSIIYLQNIIARDEKGEIKKLSSLRYILVK